MIRNKFGTEGPSEFWSLNPPSTASKIPEAEQAHRMHGLLFFLTQRIWNQLNIYFIVPVSKSDPALSEQTPQGNDLSLSHHRLYKLGEEHAAPSPSPPASVPSLALG